MSRNFVPAVSGVRRCEDGARVGAEIHTSSLAVVCGHGLTKDGEEAGGLGQPSALCLPCFARVGGSPDGGGRVGRVAALAVPVEGQGPDRVRIVGMDGDREAEGRGQARVDVVPASDAVPLPPDAVVVLLVKRVAISGTRADDVVDAMAGLSVPWRGGVMVMRAGFGIGQAVAAIP